MEDAQTQLCARTAVDPVPFSLHGIMSRFLQECRPRQQLTVSSIDPAVVAADDGPPPCGPRAGRACYVVAWAAEHYHDTMGAL